MERKQIEVFMRKQKWKNISRKVLHAKNDTKFCNDKSCGRNCNASKANSGY